MAVWVPLVSSFQFPRKQSNMLEMNVWKNQPELQQIIYRFDEFYNK